MRLTDEQRLRVEYNKGLEEGRKQERERIFKQAEEICPHGGMGIFNQKVRKCDYCWQVLKGEK